MLLTHITVCVKNTHFSVFHSFSRVTSNTDQEYPLIPHKPVILIFPFTRILTGLSRSPLLFQLLVFLQQNLHTYAEHLTSPITPTPDPPTDENDGFPNLVSSPIRRCLSDIYRQNSLPDDAISLPNDHSMSQRPG